MRAFSAARQPATRGADQQGDAPVAPGFVLCLGVGGHGHVDDLRCLGIGKARAQDTGNKKVPLHR